MDIVQSELVPYSKATEIAETYSAAIKEIKRLLVLAGAEIDKLNSAFAGESHRANFDLQVRHAGDHYDLKENDVDSLIYEFRRQAWAALFRKLDIEKCMSIKRQEEMREKLFYSSSYHRRNEDKDLPEVTPENIVSVLSGYISSADEFLEEKIREVYDWLVPRIGSEYKTNKRGRLGKKAIKTWCVEKGWSGEWLCCRSNKPGLIALDAVFRFLDGKGISTEYDGGLVTAILSTKDGRGETEYFRFKCFKNNNLHIEFIREDLLSEFNLRAGKAVLSDN